MGCRHKARPSGNRIRFGRRSIPLAVGGIGEYGDFIGSLLMPCSLSASIIQLEHGFSTSIPIVVFTASVRSLSTSMA